MSNSSTPIAPKSHYSGHNPIPTINQFIENLDRDKKDRDREIDEARKAKAAALQGQKKGQIPPPGAQGNTGDVHSHEQHKYGKEGTQKTVTDPTTGREVVIEDVNKDMMENVKNPSVRIMLLG